MCELWDVDIMKMCSNIDRVQCVWCRCVVSIVDSHYWSSSGYHITSSSCSSLCLLISAPRLGVYYFLLLTLSVWTSVRLPVTDKLQIGSSFFVYRWNRAIFWPSVLHDPLYKTVFLDFRFRPPNARNLLPKIWAKIAYKSPCTADRLKMFAPTGGFSVMADSMEPCKMLWDRPLLPWERHLA